MEDNTKSAIGAWINGMLLLKKAGFNKSQIMEISMESSEIFELLIQQYSYEDIRYQDLLKDSLKELFEGLVLLKRSGFSWEEISNILEDIKNAYFYADSFPLERDDDDDDDFLGPFGEYGYSDYEEDDDENDDDEEDDDDDGNNDDFNPKKFFPKK